MASKKQIAGALSELPYGPLSERPSTDVATDGEKWLDEHGRVSKYDADTDSWIVQDVGDPDNRVDVYGGSVDTEKIANVYDHVVDSSDDLQSILNNDIAAGESIRVGPGTHTVTISGGTGVAIDSDDIELSLHPNATIKAADSQFTASGGEHLVDVGVNGSADRFTLTGRGTIDGNKANNGEDPGNRIIHIGSGVDDPTIEDVEFINSPGKIIQQAKSGRGLTVDQIRAIDCHEGVHFESPDARVSDSYFNNTDPQDCIEPLSGADGFVVDGCVFRDPAQSGVDVFGGTDGVVSDCVVINSGEVGIQVDNGSVETTVADCIVIGADAPGIKLTEQRCTAEGNYVEDTSNAGIMLLAADCKADGNTVLNGDTGQNNAAIYANSMDCTVTDCTILYDGATTKSDGVLVEADRCEVTDCSIDNVRLDGILVSGGDKAGIHDNTIKNSGSRSVKLDNNKTENDARITGNFMGSDLALYNGDGHIVKDNDLNGPNGVNGFNATLTDTIIKDNTPAVGEHTVSLSTGSTPAARINGFVTMNNLSAEKREPVIRSISPSGTPPDSNYSWEAYPEWDNSAGEWDIVIEWRTDPGSNMDAEVKVDIAG